MTRRRAFSLFALGWALTVPRAWALPPPSVPPGFRLETLTDRVPDARELALGARGTIFVGSMGAGRVYALSPDGRVRVIARGLDLPVGVAFHDGDLYVSAVRKIVVLRDIEAHLDTPPAPETAVANLPWRSGDHDWKFIAFGPDGKLYVPIGAPCNICDVGRDFGKLTRVALPGGKLEDVAYGIRNTVGFDWQPETHALWFTDNGRDWLGDDRPDDELNRLDRSGQQFGFPYCHAGDVPDPKFGAGHPCSDFTPPQAKLGAHVAALGMRFYAGRQFPKILWGSALIAEHGSWNRSTPAGYRVVAVTMSGGRPTGQVVLLNALSPIGVPVGRPADVLPLPDGSVLISDQLAGKIYRLSYAG